MNRELLERYQVLVYLAAIVPGLVIGLTTPGVTGILELLLWPLLGLLLYATFSQVALTRLRDAFADARFLSAAIIGNFMVIPAVAWILIQLLPDDPALRLGVLLVLLVPCTDWFITFTHLGRGDTRYAIAFSPISLLLQILLLPLYLWLFLDDTALPTLAHGEILLAFTGIILLPLLLAFLTKRQVDHNPRLQSVIEHLAWLPVPLLALVVFVIAATQVGAVRDALAMLAWLLPVFVAFLVMAAGLARLLARLFRLPVAQGRTLAFSLGTRNSFVVLPIALALPAAWELAVIAIVFQSLVELIAMMLWLRWVPERLFPARQP